MAFAVSLSAYAIKKKKYKKNEPVEVVIPEPDKPAIAYKAIPDSHLKPIVQPSINPIRTETNHVHGIDVSHYQGRIDWTRVVKNKNVNYVYLKATESNALVDDTYAYNLREAKGCGLKVGSYHFFRPNVSALAQFDNFKRNVDKHHQDLLPLIDVETIGRTAVATMHTRLQEFLHLVTEEYGQRPIIYTGKNFYNKYFAGYPNFKLYKFMIAQYTPEEPFLENGDDFIIWQYSSKGRIDGIRGDVDQSRFVGNHSLSEILYQSP